MAATERGIVYEGIFGKRRLGESPAMTRDTVFRVASMVKLITSVAALQLVEQDKLSLDAPLPDIDPTIGSPQVLDGSTARVCRELRPAKGPITLRHLLTHTSGFVTGSGTPRPCNMPSRSSCCRRRKENWRRPPR